MLRTRPEGLKFRKQAPTGPFTLDFFFRQAGLAVEVDGLVHNMGGSPEHDLRRDTWLQSVGIAVLRLPAGEIMTNLDGAVRVVVARALERAPPPPGYARRFPSPAKAGEDVDAQPSASSAVVRLHKETRMTLTSHTPTVERVARVLAGLTLSRNAGGDQAHAGEEIDARWADYVPDAEAVLRTLREAGPEMAAVGDPAMWERMVRAALGQPDATRG